jgi:hypothetical protein
MDSNLNSFFVTFKIYKEGNLVHESLCPTSLIPRMYLTWAYIDSPYIVKVYDHEGILRIDSSIGWTNEFA